MFSQILEKKKIQMQGWKWLIVVSQPSPQGLDQFVLEKNEPKTALEHWPEQIQIVAKLLSRYKSCLFLIIVTTWLQDLENC